MKHLQAVFINLASQCGRFVYLDVSGKGLCRWEWIEWSEECGEDASPFIGTKCRITLLKLLEYT